ncbi:hypothetical protein OG439_07645 [Amycolatopsis sp. NBC_01307]|uniref:hypothetical protein n=1 Tax=Amycolatopsis sp. NBC_01307 TaxID=2903561 RepID=UPI002E1285CA|nr:hypothetical protein OG439_07645 [Amycolatopsis sp. NBC_01307]
MTGMPGTNEDDTPIVTGQAEAPTEDTSPRRPWRGRTSSPEEIDAAKQQWRELRPWSGPTRC